MFSFGNIEQEGVGFDRDVKNVTKVMNSDRFMSVLFQNELLLKGYSVLINIGSVSHLICVEDSKMLS